MFKKTLISLAVASSLGLTGCFDSASTGKNANPDYQISNPDIDGKTWPVFDPINSKLPIPNDLIFDSGQGDGTFGVTDSTPPVTTALNELSGASTVAPAVIQFNGQIDEDTVKYGKTVFLIELEYASGDPVQGLSNQEPPTVAGVATARADVESLDGVSAIRILPLEPLNPRKRYIAVATKGITDINGDPIVSSPSYGNLTDEDQPLGTSSLAPVRALINNLWEASAEGFFKAAELPLTADDIAISYSFTTSNDEKVLQYIAEPAAWFKDQLDTFVKVSAAKQAIAGGASDYATVKATVDGAYTAFPNIPLGDEGKTAAEVLGTLYGEDAPCEATIGAGGEAAIGCAAVALASNFASTGALPTPTPLNRSAADFTLEAPTPVSLVSAVASQVLTGLEADPSSVLAAQGTVKLPYYLGTSGTDVVTQSWVADSELAKALNQAFKDAGLSIPQADASVSTAVNYIFPFPEKQADVEVPVLVLYPAAPSIKGVVIFQHGITTDRSTALTIGSAIAANGYAVVAIDQPLHGVDEFTAEEQEELASALLTAAAASNPAIENNAETRAAVINGTFKVGVLLSIQATLQDNGVPAPALGITDPTDEAQINNAIQTVLSGAYGGEIQASLAAALSLENTVANAGSTIPGLAIADSGERHFGLSESGDAFINLSSFLTTRDNMRQSSVDHMNLRASLAGLELPLNEALSITVMPSTPVMLVGHSLGTITGMPFAAAVNADQLPATISDGTPAGTVPSTFNNIAGAAMLTPGGGVVRLLENSPTFAPRILPGLQAAAGLAQGDAGLETYFNVFQAAIDTADPINFADNAADQAWPLALIEVPDDEVIPNSADTIWGGKPLKGTFEAEDGTFVTIDSFNAPLAGSQPLALTGAMITTVSGGTHSGPVDPQDEAFGEMVYHTLQLLDSVVSVP
ncbi:hypothetical protein [Marinobacter sp.]|uniref:hypothetical protein n=1 Tax=Marinobacter sp. TaxID=50741 RepID=UPI0035651E24